MYFKEASVPNLLFLFSESLFYIPKKDNRACVAWVRYIPFLQSAQARRAR